MMAAYLPPMSIPVLSAGSISLLVGLNSYSMTNAISALAVSDTSAAVVEPTTAITTLGHIVGSIVTGSVCFAGYRAFLYEFTPKKLHEMHKLYYYNGSAYRRTMFFSRLILPAFGCILLTGSAGACGGFASLITKAMLAKKLNEQSTTSS